MTRLAICNTYSQLIITLRLIETLWQGDQVDLVLSDHSIGTREACENLRGLGIFRNVYWRATKEMCAPRSGVVSTVAKVRAFCFGVEDREITENDYDEVSFFNVNTYLRGVYSKLSDRRRLSCSMFEEGVLSYAQSDFPNKLGLKLCDAIRDFMGKRHLEEDTKLFYCFYPEFYRGALTPVAIPRISRDSAVGEVLLRVFGITKDMFDIKEKYIFFTSVYDFEGGDPIGEFGVVKQCADLLGRDNLIVKTHPRDTRTVYADNGLHVYRNSTIPWEAIQIFADYSDKVFLTASSGSVLSGNAMSGSPAKTFYMHKLCNLESNPSAQKTLATLENLLNNAQMQKTFKDFHIAEKIEDILCE